LAREEWHVATEAETGGDKHWLWQPPESGKRWGRSAPWRIQRTQPCQDLHLNFFSLQNSKRIYFCSFKPFSFGNLS
jgi:hypothetical protein